MSNIKMLSHRDSLPIVSTILPFLIPILSLIEISKSTELIPFTFCPVSSFDGTKLCASGSPTLSLTSVSITKCALECMTRRTTQCVSFNYNQTASQCEIHDHQPTSLVASTSCTNYQVRDFVNIFSTN